MKKLKFWVPFLLLTSLSLSCTKKISNTPAYPPGANYFSVKNERLVSLEKMELTIIKTSSSGNVTKNITEIIKVSDKNVFRITTSWDETKKLFSNGDNVFQFKYGTTITDTVSVKTLLNLENSTIEYLEVKYNNKLIVPTISNSPAEQSKIFNIE
ncbi:MAG: hypothetical protein JWN56_1279 [Sphingobacteriales bacterium]|nr:hypothetical protein [Sphingobacteriales bacterium]